MSGIKKERLTKNSSAVKKIIELFKNGEILETDLPKDVYYSEDIIQRFNINTFRTKFNSIKQQWLERSG